MRKLSFIPMNLQLFAEDSGVGGEVAASQSTEGQSTEGVTGSATGTEGSQGSEGGQGTEGNPSAGTEPATQPKQTPEQNAAFADLRRKAEAAEKRAIELETQRQKDIEIAKKYGKEYNIYSDADVEAQFGKSHGLKTIADFEEALQRQEYQEKGIDPDMINKLIEDHPAIKQAKEQEAARKAAEQDRFLVDSFNELKGEYPDIKEVEDVPADVWKKWNGGSTGLSLTDAFYLVNRKEIISKQTDAAKQATLNNLQNKNHVRGNGQGVEGDTFTIPDDVLEQYKKFVPGKTLEEYKKHYKSSLK